MRDALVNLVSNAHKYGGTPPSVKVDALLTPKGQVGIAVTDNGEGIPRPEQRRIFEKFYPNGGRRLRRASKCGPTPDAVGRGALATVLASLAPLAVGRPHHADHSNHALNRWSKMVAALSTASHVSSSSFG
jgi:DNA topoisomerase VI subunit B